MRKPKYKKKSVESKERLENVAQEIEGGGVQVGTLKGQGVANRAPSGNDLSKSMCVSRRRCIGRYVCCSYGVVWGVEGGRGLPVRRHSCGGHRMEL